MSGGEFYASPTGTAQGDGTLASPWDLQTALDNMQPGRRLKLVAGTYGTGFTAYTLNNGGTAAYPVTIEPAGDRWSAVINGGLTVAVGASYSTWRYLVTTCTETTRTTETPGSFPPDVPRAALNPFSILASHTTLIHCVSMDGSNQITSWSTATDNLFYGCHVQNGGWLGPDRGHGHMAYLQNSDPAHPKTLKHCTFAPGFGTNMLATFGSSDDENVQGFTHLENVYYGQRTLIFGGHQSIIARNNHAWDCVCSMNTDLTIVPTATGEYTDNWSYNSQNVGGVQLYRWFTLTGSGNVIIGAFPQLGTPVLVLAQAVAAGWAWDNNTYYRKNDNNDQINAFSEQGVGFYNLAAWQTATGLDLNSTLTIGLPTANSTHLYPSEKDANLALLVCKNWEALNEITVDLTACGWPNGASVKARHILNFFDDVQSLTMSGQNLTVNVASANRTVALPIGYPTALATYDQRFAAFWLERV